MNTLTGEKSVVITGAGISGLLCAVILVKNNIKTALYDRMDNPGRKLLLAGMSGFNLTKDEDLETFSSRYWSNELFFKKLLFHYSPEKFIAFLDDLGIETFRGSSGKIFPVFMTGDEVLNKIMTFLENSSLFSFYPKHRFIEIDNNNSLVFETDSGIERIRADIAVFALGGGSRKKTGSDGKWIEVFKSINIKTSELEPANCGFEVNWSEIFKEYLKSSVPLKNISLSCGGITSRSEILLSCNGIEGSGIYFLSSRIREKLKAEKYCCIEVDIFPDLSVDQIQNKLKKVRGKNSFSNYLRKALSVNPVKFKLIKELLKREQYESIIENPEILKKLPVNISGIPPLEEAISSSGGVCMNEINENMMLKQMPGFYVIGEMADWEAPTGGYLIQGCYSTACAAAADIIRTMGEYNSSI